MIRVKIALFVSFAALALTLIGNISLVIQVKNLNDERAQRSKAVNSAIKEVAGPLINLLSASFVIDKQHAANLSKKDLADFQKIRTAIFNRTITHAQHIRFRQILRKAGFDSQTIKAADVEIASIRALSILAKQGVPKLLHK